MAAWIQTSDDDPLFHVGGRPFRVTETLVVLHIMAWVALAFAHGFNVDMEGIRLFSLSTSQVLGHGWVCQLLTYPFINALQPIFVLTVLMLFFFGRTVERAIGRRPFLLLYLGLTVVPAIVLCLVSLATNRPLVYYGVTNIDFALFVAFALVFPEAPMLLFGVQAKWMAVGFAAVSTLIDIAYHEWIDLLVLWTALGVAVAAIRFPFLGAWLNDLREKQEQAKLERERAKVAAVVAEKKASEARRHQSIDPILDKISKTGMQSLTREERLVLEEARKELLRRDGAK